MAVGTLRISMTEDQKLEKFATRELARNLDTMILPDDNGGYVVFGKYHLVPDHAGVTVHTLDDQMGCFSNKRSAISWCIADKRQQVKLAHNIKFLDQKKQVLAADIQCRSNVAKNGHTEEFYELVTTKIQTKIESYNTLNTELEKCLISAKYLQIRGFNNETARTSGSRPRKTNS